MVEVEYVRETRPQILDEFHFSGNFQPRTPEIARAYELGKHLHRGQLRLSGEPYFETHCAWVAEFIDRLLQNEAWTIAALLHDAVEDQDESLSQIQDYFPGSLGKHVAFLVDGVTKMSNPREGQSRELETLRKIARFRDPGVFLIKLADKSHNIKTLEFMSPQKQRQKATEAIRAYGKLAGILNCYRWRRWLEDMAFPFAEPEVYNFVRGEIDRDPRLELDFINGMLAELRDLMEAEGVSGKIRIIVNGYWQAWQKLRRMARGRQTSLNDFSDVNDVVSFRMLVENDNIPACYQLLARVNRFFNRNLEQGSFDDYIANPQDGYRALQVSAWLPGRGSIEVAIATEEMEGENLWGVVYALQNKKPITQYRPVQIFTPTGGTRFLPDNSTVLDAVASIQDFLMDKINRVEVNNELRALDAQVFPGDVVEVITHGARIVPSEEWLKFCNLKTARVLRSVLIMAELKQMAAEGRRKLKPLLKKRGIVDLEDVQVQERNKFENLLSTLAAASLDDIYSALGGGAILEADIEEALDEVGISKEVLGWTTINIVGPSQTNRPGVLASLASLVSGFGGNIIRTVNNTFQDGSFTLRWVIDGVNEEKKQDLLQAFLTSEIHLTNVEIV
ncbi:MAG TPA: HD domain-containing protein [Brevefilum fermentans]|jgi:(p)ppGpp synthase/HD superfamily hydrolase|uniref:Putative GTP pyrophosphokinase n=1 Tax=Candidatus Brevifilum fermentans TaxID=1986204 RepID=A0A1Y6K4R1_9CHLR|nr:HD domain-containing protein [Brevefilum fermentans]MDI9566304.1 HD domain-containing protein [Chloroflexota bacterium]OQB83695.1 MAG: Bifunctional (p)ppGpp synthase/hydrolase relA [Chloroflexi bacterium ADurb.Bin120]SMX54685.1 putative GTP pyrophosphokinase [Brevefilum fermentans]HOM67727.1 HD domain-containing protein [Brevefilum fermentans]HPX96249.1 HD domain-containing protein [Brevefilum fermentans]